MDANALFHYFGFIFSSVLLGLAFLSIAVLISVIAGVPYRASGMAIATWFFFVLVFDLILLGILVTTGGKFAGDSFAWMLLLNPADVFRILNVFSLEVFQYFVWIGQCDAGFFGQPAQNRWRYAGVDCFAPGCGKLEV